MKTATLVDKTGNQINVIHPYKTKAGWSFDDEQVRLQGEPFILGTEKIITSIVGKATNFTAYISHAPIPQHSGLLIKLTADEIRKKNLGMDNWYRLNGTDQVGWLCPATLKYFRDYPDSIYFKIEN
jgi:hypothetical protein